MTISTLLIVSTGAITYHGVFDRIDHTMILLMLGGFIFQGATEEVLCRGIVLQLLKGRVPISLAIGINTVLFIAPHLSNMGGVSAGIVVFALIDLVLISVLFSLLTLHYQTLWVACGAHSLWNFILYNILGLNLSGKDDVTAAVFEMRTVGSNLLNGGIYGIEASAVTAIVLATAVILMIGINRKGRAADGIQ